MKTNNEGVSMPTSEAPKPCEVCPVPHTENNKPHTGPCSPTLAPEGQRADTEVWIDPRTKEPCRRCDGTGKMPPWPHSKGLVVCGVCHAEMRPLANTLSPQEERNRIIEEAARVCDDYKRDGENTKEYCVETADELAARIRNLKAAPKVVDSKEEQPMDFEEWWMRL